jgi:hypothetical protein
LRALVVEEAVHRAILVLAALAAGYAELVLDVRPPRTVLNEGGTRPGRCRRCSRPKEGSEPMWFWARTGIATLLAAALVTAGYSEFVLDTRTPRSTLLQSHVVDSISSYPMKDFAAVAAAMARKYGPNAETRIESPPPRWVVAVDDKVVHEEPLPLTFEAALGVFEIGKRGQVASRFPFRLDPQVVPPPQKYSTRDLRQRFGHGAGVKYLDFRDADVAQGPCVVLAAPDLGGIGRLLRIETGTFCIIDWSGSAPASALVGAATRSRRSPPCARARRTTPPASWSIVRPATAGRRRHRCTSSRSAPPPRWR